MTNNVLICEIQQDDKGFGYLSKKLVSKMLIVLKRVW